MKHSPGFLKVVEEARSEVQEVDLDETRRRLDENSSAVLLDVREDEEWKRSHAKGAEHLGRGVLERDLETRFPDPNTEIIMYCGGGYRSVLACQSAQRMGYHNVKSLAGGFRALNEANWPMES